MNPISKDLGVTSNWVLLHRAVHLRATGRSNEARRPSIRITPARVCKVCGSPDKGDFNAPPDDTWKTVIPIEYQNKLVCVLNALGSLLVKSK
jgi:hypothetical protein